MTFRGAGGIEHKMCVGISLELLSKMYLILRNKRDITINVYTSLIKVHVILVRF